jgi:hypothetical protein
MYECRKQSKEEEKHHIGRRICTGLLGRQKSFGVRQATAAGIGGKIGGDFCSSWVVIGCCFGEFLQIYQVLGRQRGYEMATFSHSSQFSILFFLQALLTDLSGSLSVSALCRLSGPPHHLCTWALRGNHRNDAGMCLLGGARSYRSLLCAKGGADQSRGASFLVYLAFLPIRGRTAHSRWDSRGWF